MSTIDLLLTLDKSKLEKPTKQVEVTRLSAILGEKFIVTCQALDSDEFEQIQDSVSVTTEGTINTGKNIQAEYVAKGVCDPDFGNLKVVEYFGATNASEAITKLLLPGEITNLFNIINNLSGFGKNTVVEIKNESNQTEK